MKGLQSPALNLQAWASAHHQVAYQGLSHAPWGLVLQPSRWAITKVGGLIPRLPGSYTILFLRNPAGLSKSKYEWSCQEEVEASCRGLFSMRRLLCFLNFFFCKLKGPAQGFYWVTVPLYINSYTSFIPSVLWPYTSLKKLNRISVRKFTNSINNLILLLINSFLQTTGQH